MSEDEVEDLSSLVDEEVSEMSAYKVTETIVEMPDAIILGEYEKQERVQESYQSERELELELMENLRAQGYERLVATSREDLERNLREKMQKLNDVQFSDSEWDRFMVEYLNAPNDGLVEKTRKIQENYIYDFTFDDGVVKNIKIIDKKNTNRNSLQVVNQVTQTGSHHNRYDVTILVNGLPLVHVELKKRGVNLREAFNQIHRYQRESFNAENSLYKYVQIFVISNGTYTRYFANTTAQDNGDYEYTIEWADAKNNTICDLKDFTATFFERRVLLEVLTKYCVFNTSNDLLILRPYQIAATERILWKIKSSFENKTYGKTEAGGYVWHTTGSGKTLTSFKAARLATGLPYISKVFFVVDRKDLDYQTMKEYQKFQPNSVNGSKNTQELTKHIESADDKIIVTTIQKLNEFVKRHAEHPIYDQQCVLIYDECHRSQFGEAQKNIQSSFNHYYQFGFTGTPIFPENALGTETTAGVFGPQLHSYVITDAIRDEKVLKFKVDYNNVSAGFRSAETEQNIEKLQQLESRKFLKHADRIAQITSHILDVYDTKTHRNENYDMASKRAQGFNAMFAVHDIDSAKLYYEEFKKQQAHLAPDKRLRVATIFSYQPNEEVTMRGDLLDENFNVDALETTSKEFLDTAMQDYNSYFKTNFSTSGGKFQDYYRDVSERVRNREVDLLIVVGMFLTGFDAKTLNTLFVDKNLRYHGLIQAFSRTNRIYNRVKAFGNIVCFRDLEEATKNAIRTFGDEKSVNTILEKSYQDYMEGYVDEETGEAIQGYRPLCREITEKFPEPTEIKREDEKKEFAQLFGELLKTENVLKNFDEFFKESDNLISERQMQDMKSVYVDIREESITKNVDGDDSSNEIAVDFSDVEFQIDLLKTDEINLDYILDLIFEESSKQEKSPAQLKSDVKRLIRSSLGTRAKENLIIEFMERTDLSALNSKDETLTAFYDYARAEKKKDINQLVEKENLSNQNNEAERFIQKSIDKGYAQAAGTELDNLIQSTSRRHGAREKKRQTLLGKIQHIVEVFVGI